MTRYPTDIKPLTSLRFVAAAWVLVYHFRDHLGVGLDQIGLVAHGWLGVDLFFVLSGFILTHVYLQSFEQGRYRPLAFLWNRLARVYPLHAATLGAMLAMYAVAQVMNVEVGAPAAFDLRDVPAHLLLVHAWHTTAQVGWNFPSWSISAEWAAYLVFPLILAATAVLKQRPLVLLAMAVAFLYASHALLTAYVRSPWGELTAHGGALRIMPLFTLGVALYRVGQVHALPAGAGWALTAAATAWILVAVTIGAPVEHILPALGAVVFGLAEVSRRGGGGVFDADWAVYLGVISYALYMVHLPVDVAVFQILQVAGVDEQSPAAIRFAAVGLALAASLAAAFVAYVAIEKPARDAMRRLGDRWFAPRPVAAE